MDDFGRWTLHKLLRVVSSVTYKGPFPPSSSSSSSTTAFLTFSQLFCTPANFIIFIRMAPGHDDGRDSGPSDGSSNAALEDLPPQVAMAIRQIRSLYDSGAKLYTKEHIRSVIQQIDHFNLNRPQNFAVSLPDLRGITGTVPIVRNPFYEEDGPDAEIV